MKLTHENGDPSKRWSIGLPNKEFKVEGDIIVMLNDGEPATVKAVYKKRTIILTFNVVTPLGMLSSTSWCVSVLSALSGFCSK